MASLSYYLKRNSKSSRPQSTNRKSIHIKDWDASFLTNLNDLTPASKCSKFEQFSSQTPHEQLKAVFIQNFSHSRRPLSSSTQRSNISRHIINTQSSHISSESMLNQARMNTSSQGYIDSNMIPKGIIMLDRPGSSHTPRFSSRPKKTLTNENSDPFEKGFECFPAGYKSRSRPRSSNSVPRRTSLNYVRPREVLDSQQLQELIHSRPIVKEKPEEIDPLIECYEYIKTLLERCSAKPQDLDYIHFLYKLASKDQQSFMRLLSCLDMLVRFHKLSLDIVSAIEKREMQLSLIKSMLIDGIRLKAFKDSIVPKLISLRMMSLNILESISKWKVIFTQRFFSISSSFLWRNLDYLKKMQKDSKSMLANPIFLKLKKVLLKDLIFFEPRKTDKIPVDGFQFGSSSEFERYRDIIEDLVCSPEISYRILNYRKMFKSDTSENGTEDMTLLNWQNDENLVKECVMDKTFKIAYEMINYRKIGRI